MIFPSKIERAEITSKESIVPKFFTFVSTDELGINTFFHCLTYYELFTKQEAKNWGDEESLLVKS